MKQFIIDVAWLSLQYFCATLGALPFAIIFASMHVNHTNTESWDMFLFGCSMVGMSVGWGAFNKVKNGKWAW
jgi:hypothetical protein